MNDRAKERAPKAAAVVGLRALLLAGDQYRQRAASHFGLTVTDTYAISHLNADYPISQGELAERVGMTSGGATSMIDRLERADLVRRTADPNDRRRHLLEPTARAQAIVSESAARLEHVFDVFDATQLGRLSEELRLVAERLAAAGGAFAAEADDDALSEPGIAS